MTDDLKVLVAKKALNYLQPGSSLGVGTGSTVDFFIEELGKSRLTFSKIFSTSIRSTKKLIDQGFNVNHLSELKEPLSIYIDGADEIDEMHCMTKGGGGALTLEKIVAEISSTFICLVDETKLVQSLGKFPIPIEVISEAVNPIIQKIKTKYGGDAIVRKNFLTDHGNQILDLHNLTINNPVSLEKNLNSIPGVVTNGIFAIRKANMVLVGTNSGLKILKSSGFD